MSDGAIEVLDGEGRFAAAHKRLAVGGSVVATVWRMGYDDARRAPGFRLATTDRRWIHEGVRERAVADGGAVVTGTLDEAVELVGLELAARRGVWG